MTLFGFWPTLFGVLPLSKSSPYVLLLPPEFPYIHSETVNGLVAENNYIIGDDTYFLSEMKNIDKDKPSNGNASSSLFHNMTLTVDQTNSSFTTSFSQDF